MGYEIEISCSVGLAGDVKDSIIAKAKRCKCEYHYEQYELEGRRRQIYRMQYIISFIFPEDCVQLQTFIRYIKALRNVHIECIVMDSGAYEIIYASPKYLSLMSKEKAKEYRLKIKS